METPGRTFFWQLTGVIFVVFMTAPLVLVVLFSFTGGDIAAFPIPSLSLRWWRALFAKPEFYEALQNTAIIGVSVSAISTIVGTVTALGMLKLSERAAAFVTFLLGLPLLLPALVLAVSLLSFFIAIGLKLGLFTVILSHLLFTLPFVVMIIFSRLRTFDLSVIESARDLGASPMRAFWTVTLPILTPTLIGAALIALSLSIDDLIITFFTGSGAATLPTLVWSMIRTNLTPATNALGTLLLAVTLGGTLIAMRLTKFRG